MAFKTGISNGEIQMKYAFKQKYFINIKYNIFKELLDFFLCWDRLPQLFLSLLLLPASLPFINFKLVKIEKRKLFTIWMGGWMWKSVGWVAATIYPSIYLPPWPLQVQFISQIINQTHRLFSPPTANLRHLLSPPI